MAESGALGRWRKGWGRGRLSRQLLLHTIWKAGLHKKVERNLLCPPRKKVCLADELGRVRVHHFL